MNFYNGNYSIEEDNWFCLPLRLYFHFVIPPFEIAIDTKQLNIGTSDYLAIFLIYIYPRLTRLSRISDKVDAWKGKMSSEFDIS